MKKILPKIFILTPIILLIISIYFYFVPKATITIEIIENDLKPKFRSAQNNDSLFVFIPYKFSIKNNSLKNIKLIDIICEQNYDGTLYSQLIYSQEGHETLMDDEYGNFTDENILKPFEKKVFYFYLKNLAPKNDFDNAEYVEDLCCKLPAKIIEKHIENLHENVTITPKTNVISNLYKNNKNKDIEITLTDNTEVKIVNYSKIDSLKYKENYILKSKL